MVPAVIQGPAEGRVRDRRSTATGGTMPVRRGSPTRFRRPEARVGTPASRRTAGGLGTVQLGTTRRPGGRPRRPGRSRYLSGSRRSPRDPRPGRRPGLRPPPISSPPDAVLRPLLTAILRRPRIASPRRSALRPLLTVIARRPAPRPLPTVVPRRLVLARPPIPGPPGTGPRLLWTEPREPWIGRWIPGTGLPFLWTEPRVPGTGPWVPGIGSRVPGTRPSMNERRLPRSELRIRAAPDRGRCLLVATPGWSDPRLLGRPAGSVPTRRVGSSASDGRRRGRRPVQLRRRPRTGLPGTSRPLPGGRMLRWTTRATRHVRWNRGVRSFLSDLKQAPVDRLVLREPTPEAGGRGAR